MSSKIIFSKKHDLLKARVIYNAKGPLFLNIICS